MKKIKDLIECNYDIEIVGITDDSREVQKGYLFVATKGYNVDHFDFVESAIENGAVCVVSDRKIEKDIPNVLVEDVNKIYPLICSKFYDVDLDEFSFIGITGTDGKTTTTTIVRELLNKKIDTAYIGTNGIACGNQNISTSNTTPCTKELYKDLDIIRKSKCKNIAMEVSSEALLHNRVDNIKYKVVGYTNITEDHLNVHKTIENYIECKRKLINYLEDDGIAIINGDDVNCKNIRCDNMITYGFDSNCNCVISDVKELSNETTFNIKYLGNNYKITSPFRAIYNVYNVTLAFLICLQYGLDSEYLIDEISKLKPVKGRGEMLNFGQNFEILLDYAHTYNGIKNVIESINKDKKIIVVTGCAGGREKDKRKLIGKYILDNVDVAIFTMDDPRFESVDSIIDDMISLSDKEYIRIIDRPTAIKKAFDIADNNSIVLILGKGRDNYMAIGDEKLPYNDYNVIEEYFK